MQHAPIMVSKTVNLVSTLFKHTRGEKPPHYLAQVVNYTQASDKFGVIFFKEYSEEVLRDFIGSYSGRVKKVKKGSKRARGEPKIFEYSAADFWKAFRGYADHADNITSAPSRFFRANAIFTAASIVRIHVGFVE